MKIRFQPNPNLERELAEQEAMGRALLARAIDVKRGIRGQLPSGAGGGRRVAAYAGRAYADRDGSRVTVGTRWRLGHIIEFGSVNNPAYSPLRKAVRATGLKFVGGA